MKQFWIISILGLSFLLAFSSTKNNQYPVPKGWPKPVYNFSKNPLSKDKIQLGRALFYDPILSRNNTISCNSCHSSYTAFAHVDHDLSHGIDNRIGKRNAPALMNLAWSKKFMWDGAVNHLEVQALAPMTNPNEMDEELPHVIEKLQASNLYKNLFCKAYGDSTVTSERLLKAITQFMLTIVSANSKYDKVIRHEESFTPQELNGYHLFQKNCASCHREPLFTDGEFKNNGLSVDTALKDYGRVVISQNPDDSFKFKVPTLRNIEFSFPYMHDGRFKKLSEVINHYTNGIVKSKTLSQELRKPIVLSSNEKVDLLAFLLTLTDKEFLFNQDYAYPKNIFMPVAKK